jgi:hypothetical protein
VTDASAPSGEAFRQIDDLACGTGFAPTAIVEGVRALQEAVGRSEPVCRRTASALLAKPDARIVLFTGFVVPERYPRGENDGPLGTVALARALRRLGRRCEIRVDPEILETVRWLAAELGVDVHVEPIDPADPVEPGSFDVAVAVEKPGANSLGVMHTFDGHRIVGGSRPIDAIFDAFRLAGKTTIGLGDQGNEVGFGLLGDVLGTMHPALRSCACGCGGGIAAATPAQYLYPAAVSNWGCYAIVAALALQTQTASLLLEPAEERRMLHVCAIRGCCDGIRRRGAYGIDGLAGSVSVGLVGALRDLVIRHLAAAS